MPRAIMTPNIIRLGSGPEVAKWEQVKAPSKKKPPQQAMIRDGVELRRRNFTTGTVPVRLRQFFATYRISNVRIETGISLDEIDFPTSGNVIPTRQRATKLPPALANIFRGTGLRIAYDLQEGKAFIYRAEPGEPGLRGIGVSAGHRFTGHPGSYGV